MSKLTLDALKERAGVVTSTDLLNSISGGTENACHDDAAPRHPLNKQYDETGGRNPLSSTGQYIVDTIWGWLD